MVEGRYTSLEPAETKDRRGSADASGPVRVVHAAGFATLVVVCRPNPESGRLHLMNKAAGSGANNCTVVGSAATMNQVLLVSSCQLSAKKLSLTGVALPVIETELSTTDWPKLAGELGCAPKYTLRGSANNAAASAVKFV